MDYFASIYSRTLKCLAVTGENKPIDSVFEIETTITPVKNMGEIGSKSDDRP